MPLAGTVAQAAEVGAPPPGFTLTDLDGGKHSLAGYLEDGKTVVLEWFNPDCPFVKKHHLHNHTMIDTHAANPDVVWLAINSGADGKQGHGVTRNRKAAEDYEMDYPILLDETGEVGRAYGAKTTPHMFVIAGGVIVYAGAIDDNPTPGKLGERNHVAAALKEVGDGKEVSVKESKPYGCSVKYGEKPAKSS
ncbi:redoxin domain-containing protein [bacterium]|nr:redoxin domain-containing protein [bacterium]